MEDGGLEVLESKKKSDLLLINWIYFLMLPIYWITSGIYGISYRDINLQCLSIFLFCIWVMYFKFVILKGLKGELYLPKKEPDFFDIFCAISILIMFIWTWAYLHF